MLICYQPNERRKICKLKTGICSAGLERQQAEGGVSAGGGWRVALHPEEASPQTGSEAFLQCHCLWNPPRRPHKSCSALLFLLLRFSFCHKQLPEPHQVWQAGPAPCMWDNIPQPQCPCKQSWVGAAVGAKRCPPVTSTAQTPVTDSCAHIARTVCESGMTWGPEILS